MSGSTKKASETPANVLFHAPSPSHINAQLLLAHVRSSISTHFGDCGLGLTSAILKIIYFSPATSTAILRCPRAHVRMVWAALTFIDQMPGVRKHDRGRDCVIQVVRVSGTIKKSEEELIRRSRKEIVKARAAEEGRLDQLIGVEGLQDSKMSVETGIDSDDGIENLSDKDSNEDIDIESD